MKVTLSHVARVESAQIEMNGITVVAGLNGSGKTTVSRSIYAMMKGYKNLTQRIENSRRDSIYRAMINLSHGSRAIGFNDAVSSFVVNLPYKKLINQDEDECRDIVNKYIEERREIEVFLDVERRGSFAAEEKKKLCDNICAVMTRTNEVYTTFLVESSFLNVFSGQINSFNSEEIAKIKLGFDDIELFSCFSDNKLTNNTFGTECDRKAIYIESFNVLDLFISSNKYRRHSRMNTVAFDDLFECLISENDTNQLFEDYENSKELERIIELIVGQVTHGKLTLDLNGNFEFHDSNTDHPVKISNLSAGIKIFVVIQSLLEKGQLNRNDVLLIDEPEVNLHPEWQVVFAEILVLLQKEVGLIIYVNTHSPYFARAIEVKMAEYGIAGKGNFYLLQEKENGLCTCSDVTQNTEKIYSMLYKPLEKL